MTLNDGVSRLIHPGLVYGVAPARGGSRGLPGKNIRRLEGRPLISWAVACGLAARSVSRVICTTDDDEIAVAAQFAGADVPFRRPDAASSDSATDMDVFAHCIQWLAANEGKLPELFVQLRPTTPFRRPNWIDEAVAMMKSDASISCVRSVTPTPHTPYKMWTIHTDGIMSPALSIEGLPEAYNLPRQALPPIFWHTGQIDVIRTTTLLQGSMTGHRIHALVVPGETAIDIDTLVDFKMAELVFRSVMPSELIATPFGPTE